VSYRERTATPVTDCACTGVMARNGKGANDLGAGPVA
jgi:hypothetical protein